MIYTDPRTVLPLGLTLSWTITLVLAPPAAVRSGGRFDKRVMWGVWTCDREGTTGSEFMEGLHREAAAREGLPQHLTTLLEIDAKST